MNKIIGFIGCGNMGEAILGGLLKSYVKKQDVIVSTKTSKTSEKIKNTYGVKAILDNKEVVKKADIVFLAVKPYMYKDVIDEIKNYVDDNKIIVTIAAGITLEELYNWFKKKVKLVKTMPNTPALVNEGMSCICPGHNISEQELTEIINIFNCFGKCEILSENDFHGFIALCGSSPAYVFMFIEAMADAAVKMGIPRKKAYRLGAQAVLGSAKMILDTEMHPGELKDMVCSPRGTTIEAVNELEKQGFRASVIKAMERCEEKSKNMEK